MSLFRKPKKTIQRRVFTEDNDEEEENQNDVPDIKPKHEDTKKKNKKEVPKKQNLLSFETDEEGEVFQVKKSSHSKKMMRLYERERRKEMKEAKAREIKQKEVVKEAPEEDVVVVVNHRQLTPPPPPILSGRDALCAGKDDLTSEEEEESDGTHRFSKPTSFKRVLESGAIPDAAMIHAARKKRQRAREQGDFIPVNDEEEIEDKGRHVREDDNEGSDDERIDMGANPLKRDQEKRREQFYEAQESDQEINEWEDQQIRKGVTAAALNQELLYNELSGHSLQIPPLMGYQAIQTVVPTKIEPGVPRTPEAILDKLKEQYETAINTKQAHEEQLKRVQRDLMLAAEELETLKLAAPKAAAKFRFYQELRGYITDLVECLDEKVGLISNLEQRALDLMSKRAEWLIERRRQDVRDQAEEVTSLGKKSLGQRLPEDPEKMRRAVEREGRRTRRRRARETASESSSHVEGMSTDDEMPQQMSSQHQQEHDAVVAEMDEVFADVVDEFKSLSSILIRFEEWRETDMSAYQEAFATLCLPKIVSPLIRLNTIFWDPLNDTVDLEKIDWYRTLALFGLHDDETESSLSRDPDLYLVPTIVEKVIIPKVTLLAERCWDPLSSSQTLRMVVLVSRFTRRFPTLGPGSKAVQNLLNAVLNKLKWSLENDVFIPIMPRLVESKNPFFQRQFANGIKLLRNITCWEGLLNETMLKGMAMTALVNRYLISAIKVCPLTDAVAKVHLIGMVLPRVWFTAADKTHLQMFHSCALSIAQQLDKDNPLHIEPIERITNILKHFRSESSL